MIFLRDIEAMDKLVNGPLSDILTRDGSDGKMPPGYFDPIKYRGYTIYYDPPPIPGWRNVAWRFVHEDYDAEIFSDGSVSADPRAGDGASWQDCMDQIDQVEGGE